MAHGLDLINGVYLTNVKYAKVFTPIGGVVMTHTGRRIVPERIVGKEYEIYDVAYMAGNMHAAVGRVSVNFSVLNKSICKVTTHVQNGR